MKRMLFLLAALLFTLLLRAGGNPDGILGVWKDGSGKGHIQIYKIKGKYYGKLIWSTNNAQGQRPVDKKNPDPALRNKPLVGLVLLRDFTYDADEEEWTGGKVYNPQDGKEYKAYMTLKNQNTLSLRGYIGFSWLGKTDTWTRVR